LASLCSPAQTPCVIMPQRTQPAPRRFDVLGVVASSSAASASSSSPPSPRSSLSAAVETTPQMVRPWWQHLRRRGRRRFQPARWRSTKWSSGSRPLEVRRIAQRIHTAHTHPCAAFLCGPSDFDLRPTLRLPTCTAVIGAAVSDFAPGSAASNSVKEKLAATANVQVGAPTMSSRDPSFPSCDLHTCPSH
jgi:hypothetical protein